MVPPVHKAAFHKSPFPGVIVEHRAPGEFYILDVNSAARTSAEWRGIPEEDVIGRNIADVFPGVGAAGQLDAYEQALANQDVVDLGEVASDDSEALSGVFSLCIVPLDDSRLLITGESVTSRVGELNQAQTAFHWYEAMVTASSGLMVFVDATYTYQAVNQAYCDEHRLAREEILGHTVADVFGEETFDTTMKPHLDRCLLGEEVTFDFWWNSPSSGRRHVYARYAPFFETDGSVSGVLVEVRDKTEQTQIEQHHERSVAALEAANQELEAFSDSVAHDLKNPLLTVTQFSEYLDEAVGEVLTEQLQGYLQRIRAAGRHMTHIIDDLRDLADLTRAEVSQERVDLSSLGHEIIEELRALVPDRDVTFEAEPGITTVGDRALLRILLTNLLQNAWKYTGPSGDARIELGVEEDETDVPIYYVRDNGIGFEDSDRERIFRAFERLHTEAEYAGTGLGLATVMRIVRRHGGRAWAEGVPGQGTILRFTLEPEPIDPRRDDRRVNRPAVGDRREHP